MVKRWAIAWCALAASLAVHVLDEALNDFLSVYNSTVIKLREAVPFLPLPVFTFQIWLIGLVAVVLILFLLAALILRGARGMRTLSYFFAWVMVANGGWHIVASVSMQKPMPGVYSAPLLLAAGIYLLFCIPKGVK